MLSQTGEGKEVTEKPGGVEKGTEQAEKARYVGKTLQETARWVIETVMVN